MNGESSPLLANDNQRKKTPIFISMMSGTAVVILLFVAILSEDFKFHGPSERLKSKLCSSMGFGIEIAFMIEC